VKLSTSKYAMIVSYDCVKEGDLKRATLPLLQILRVGNALEHFHPVQAGEETSEKDPEWYAEFGITNSALQDLDRIYSRILYRLSI
jgi:hypothetical protein